MGVILQKTTRTTIFLYKYKYLEYNAYITYCTPYTRYIYTRARKKVVFVVFDKILGGKCKMELAPKFEEATELLAKYFEKDVKIPIAKIMLEAGKRGIPLESVELASSSWALFPISIAGEAYWIDVYDAEIAKSVIKELVSKIEEENSLVSILKIVAAYYSREA